MNSNGNEKEGLSKVMGFKNEDIPINHFNDTDDLDDMEMTPFPSTTVPMEPVEIYDDASTPIEQMPVDDMVELDYNSVYMYNYPIYTELDIDYDMYNFDDVELRQMFEPWDPMMDIINQSEETECNSNLENVNDYNFVNSDNLRSTYDYSSPKIPCDINEILRNIETFNPIIIRKLISYGIPYDNARRFIRRIISLTFDYCR